MKIYADTSALIAWFHPADEFAEVVTDWCRERSPEFSWNPVLRMDLRHNLRRLSGKYATAAWHAYRGSETSRKLRACFKNSSGGLAAGRGGWLRCSSVEDPRGIFSFVAPRHPPRRARNPLPDLFLKHALRLEIHRLSDLLEWGDELSARHAPSSPAGTWDFVHVAAAQHVHAEVFITCDAAQAELGRMAGLTQVQLFV